MASSYKKISKALSRSKLLKNIITYFPFIYVFLVIYGFISKSSFYYIIDVDIQQYISIGELLLPVFTAVELAYIFLGAFCVDLLYKTVRRKKEKSHKTINKSQSQEGKKIPKWLNYSIELFFTLLLFWPIFFAIGVFLSYHQFLKSTFFRVVTFLFGFLLLGIIYVFHNRLKTKELKNLLFVLILYLITCSVYFQVMRGNSILQNSPEYKIEFTYNDTIVESNDTLVYYGKTNSYIFMRDIAAEKTKVFNLNFIPRITLQKMRESGVFSRVRTHKRDWSEHHIYQIVNTKTGINELVIKVDRRAEIFIINDKYLFPKSVEVHENDNKFKWFEPRPESLLLYDIEPPYRFIKKENDYQALIIKDGDTLIATNKP